MNWPGSWSEPNPSRHRRATVVAFHCTQQSTGKCRHRPGQKIDHEPGRNACIWGSWQPQKHSEIRAMHSTPVFAAPHSLCSQARMRPRWPRLKLPALLFWVRCLQQWRCVWTKSVGGHGARSSVEGETGAAEWRRIAADSEDLSSGVVVRTYVIVFSNTHGDMVYGYVACRCGSVMTSLDKRLRCGGVLVTTMGVYHPLGHSRS